MPEMPRKAARDGLPGGPGWAWAAVLRREADQVQGARLGLGAWVGGPGRLGGMGGGWARRARGLAARGRRPGRHP